MSINVQEAGNKEAKTISIGNCSIKLNESYYEIKDDQIFRYKIIDGKIDKKSKVQVQQVNVNSYQMRLIELLSGQDSHKDSFDKNDIKELNPEKLKASFHDVYKEMETYRISELEYGKRDLSLKILENESEEKNFEVKFDKDAYEADLERKKWTKRLVFGGIGLAILMKNKDKLSKIGGIFKTITKNCKLPKSGRLFGALALTGLITWGVSKLVGNSATAAETSSDTDKLNDEIINNEEKDKVSKKEQPKEIESTKKTEKIEKAKKTNEVKKIDKNMGTEKITVSIDSNNSDLQSEWIPHIKRIAKKSGFSEDFIASFILREGFTPNAKYKNENGGLWEIGIGHTTQANHNNKFGKGTKISLEQAFDWLLKDIKDKESKIKKFGEYYDYDNLPQPLKESILDTAFNRGEGKLNPESKNFDKNYNSVSANIKKGYYGSAAARLKQEKFYTCERGLRKRNVYRFLRTLNGLQAREVKNAMDLFNRDTEYFKQTINLLKQTKRKEAKELERIWYNIYNEACRKCGIEVS